MYGLQCVGFEHVSALAPQSPLTTGCRSFSLTESNSWTASLLTYALV